MQAQQQMSSQPIEIRPEDVEQVVDNLKSQGRVQETSTHLMTRRCFAYIWGALPMSSTSPTAAEKKSETNTTSSENDRNDSSMIPPNESIQLPQRQTLPRDSPAVTTSSVSAVSKLQVASSSASAVPSRHGKQRLSMLRFTKIHLDTFAAIYVSNLNSLSLIMSWHQTNYRMRTLRNCKRVIRPLL